MKLTPHNLYPILSPSGIWTTQYVSLGSLLVDLDLSFASQFSETKERREEKRLGEERSWEARLGSGVNEMRKVVVEGRPDFDWRGERGVSLEACS